MGSIEQARYEIVESLDEDIEMLVYIAHHPTGETRAVLAGGSVGHRVELVAALIASVSSASGADIDEIAMSAAEEAREIEINSKKDL